MLPRFYGKVMMAMSTGFPRKAAWGSRLPRTEINIHRLMVLANSRGAQLQIPQKHGFHNSNVYLSLVTSGHVPRLRFHPPPPLPAAGCCPHTEPDRSAVIIAVPSQHSDWVRLLGVRCGQTLTFSRDGGRVVASLVPSPLCDHSCCC